MKLVHVRVKDFRSLSGEHSFDLTSGINYVVGPNNCGKSNLVRALEFALDPDVAYLPERDRPARAAAQGGAPPQTRITLTFDLGTSGTEKTLRNRAKAYELALRESQKKTNGGRGAQTYAEEGQVRVVTSFGARGARSRSFQAKGCGASSLPVDSDEHVKLARQFDSVLRFAVIHSGQDLESLLQGKFREILQLVIADHLGEALERADQARTQYLNALQKELLQPLRDRIQEQVGGTFPEIVDAQLIPSVPQVSETLSSVTVELGDAATTPLAEKGTGVRGTVLISMLQYLAEQSRRSLVLVTEEPEAFLHPAAQESVKERLEQLADRSDVSVVVTTHSPHVISRKPEASVTELHKAGDGWTSIVRTTSGAGDLSDVTGALYRDPGMAAVLERVTTVPANCTAVLVTEGHTDGAFLQLACDAANRPDLMNGIHIIPAGGASKVVVQAVLASQATSVPVVVLLDHDPHGQSAAKSLVDLFNWRKGGELFSLREWTGACNNHDTEIESLIPERVIAKTVRLLGEAAAIDGKDKCGDRWHYAMSKEWKTWALENLGAHLDPEAASDLVWVVEEVHRRADGIARSRARAKEFQRRS